MHCPKQGYCREFPATLRKLPQTPFFGSYLSHLSEMATTRPNGSPVGERIGDLALVQTHPRREVR